MSFTSFWLVVKCFFVLVFRMLHLFFFFKNILTFPFFLFFSFFFSSLHKKTFKKNKKIQSGSFLNYEKQKRK